MTTKTCALASDLDSQDRVLVVDDEPLIRWSLSETLGHLGYAVVEAGDARGAMGAARDSREPFGVVVLDVRLPDSDGLGLLANLHRLMPHARIILMTAHGSPELAENAIGLGACCVLNKPFEMSALAEIIHPTTSEHQA